jgi:hypothetical protein
MGDSEIGTLRKSAGWGCPGCQALTADARHESDWGYSEGDYRRGSSEPYLRIPEARQDTLDEERFHELIKCAESPWFFLTHYAYTQDPVLGVTGYPAYPFLRNLIHAMYHNRLVLIPKSRQMLMSWSAVGYFLWKAIFTGPSLILFLSRGESSAQELLLRTRFLYDHLPRWMQPALGRDSREELELRRIGSRIISLPATRNAPRMYSPSAVFWDEMAFTPWDEDIWAALKPAVDSGGSFLGVSSSGGPDNLFYRLVTKGRTEGFDVHRVHYSQHPLRDDAWITGAKKGMSQSRWDREQEISFAGIADRVYCEFDPLRHLLDNDWAWKPELPTYRSIDFGYCHPFVQWFQVTPEGTIVLFDEWEGLNQTSEEMISTIHRVDERHSISEDRVAWTSCDPAGKAKGESGISPVERLQHAGIKVRFRNSSIRDGIDLVKSKLKDASGNITLVFSPRAEHSIQHIQLYRWRPGHEEPEKDHLVDHSMDALRYFVVNYFAGGSRKASIPPRALGIPRA